MWICSNQQKSNEVCQETCCDAITRTVHCPQTPCESGGGGWLSGADGAKHQAAGPAGKVEGVTGHEMGFFGPVLDQLVKNLGNLLSYEPLLVPAPSLKGEDPSSQALSSRERVAWSNPSIVVSVMVLLDPSHLHQAVELPS